MKGFLQNDNGGWSATRLAMLLWVVGVLVIWAYRSIQAGQVQGIPQSVVTIIGILVTGKVVQRIGELRFRPRPGPVTLRMSRRECHATHG
jgi:hypothetical protein